ncbi:unnamed protein product [Caenorhabditis bovis]|uniref:Uncharacterized protein n=1 Tax=Caenorhabditis bovis TaxID=2654633 RepID=A0A8S1F3R0_9PELO|nr:unnamed protein product [Caenorhabditis bovis]
MPSASTSSQFCCCSTRVNQTPIAVPLNTRCQLRIPRIVLNADDESYRDFEEGPPPSDLLEIDVSNLPTNIQTIEQSLKIDEVGTDRRISIGSLSPAIISNTVSRRAIAPPQLIFAVLAMTCAFVTGLITTIGALFARPTNSRTHK